MFYIWIFFVNLFVLGVEFCNLIVICIIFDVFIHSNDVELGFSMGYNIAILTLERNLRATKTRRCGSPTLSWSAICFELCVEQIARQEIKNANQNSKNIKISIIVVDYVFVLSYRSI